MKFLKTLALAFSVSINADAVTVVGYYASYYDTQLATTIQTLGYQAVKITNFSTFDFGAVNKVMILDYGESGTINPALTARKTAINSFVEGGGSFYLSSGSSLSTTYLSNVFDGPLITRVSGASNDVVFATNSYASLVEDGITGNVAEWGLAVNYTYHNTMAASSVNTLENFSPILVKGSNPSHIASFIYTKGNGLIYFDSMNTNLMAWATNATSDQYQYIANTLALSPAAPVVSSIPEPTGALTLAGLLGGAAFLRRRRA